MKLDKKNTFKKTNVTYLKVSADDTNQRIDNFLIGYLKKLPKSHIYKILRKGEVRVNKKRVKADYRLQQGDDIRVPPLMLDTEAKKIPPSNETLASLENRIIFENEYLLVLNKPSGMSVHAGSTVRLGIIEALRYLYPKLPQLELVHRIDSDTSGCLIIAKKKRILRECHQLLREGKVKKTYLALTKGKWQDKQLRVDLPLHKTFEKSGKHLVSVNAQGKTALTVFKTLESFKEASLMEVALHTGRTHQIRVHAQSQGHAIAGDNRYGDTDFNKLMAQLGLKRLFLHAKLIELTLPSENLQIKVEAPLDKELLEVVQTLKIKSSHSR